METSVIISSYNQFKSLELGLYALLLQDKLDFEVIVADDGSEPVQAEMVNVFAKTAPFEVIFITHEDLGLRKSTILNKAVLAAKGDKLIFLDGDCIVFPNHISFHTACLQPGRFCAGGRIFLNLEQSLGVTKEFIKMGGLSKYLTPENIKDLRIKHRTSVLQGLFGMRRSPRIVGCNFSVMREDLFKVNGFDETLNSQLKEDSDLRNRLRNNGFKGVSLFTKNIVCHLDHGLDRKSHHSANKRAANPAYYNARKTALTAAVGLKELECRND